MGRSRQILIEGYTPAEILALTDEQLDAFVFTGEPHVFRVGSATVLGAFRRSIDRITLELAQIDGGGEGVLPTLWRVSKCYAELHRLRYVEWVVHAVNCAQPNPKSRRVLVRRGFAVCDIPGFGVAYYYLHDLGKP